MLQDIELLDSGNILKGLRFPHKIKKVTQIVIYLYDQDIYQK